MRRQHGRRSRCCTAAISSLCSASPAGPGPPLEELGSRIRARWDLASLPGPLAQLDGRLQQRELVRPGGEAARPAEVVEPPEHAHERVVGRLRRAMSSSSSPRRYGSEPASSGDLEPGGAVQGASWSRASLRAAPAALSATQQCLDPVDDESQASGVAFVPHRLHGLHGSVGHRHSISAPPRSERGSGQPAPARSPVRRDR